MCPSSLTIFSRYCSRDSTVASGSIFNMRPVRSIRAVSPGARSRRKRSLLVKICQSSEAQSHRPRKAATSQNTALTCRLYEDPGVSYRCRGRRSMDSRTAISLRIKATAGRLGTEPSMKRLSSYRNVCCSYTLPFIVFVLAESRLEDIDPLH